MGSSQKATESHKAACRAIEELGKMTRQTTSQMEISKAAALGKNILHEELGMFGPWEGENYNLTEGEKSRLLAHTRQDIAATYGLASEGLRAAMDAQKIAKQNKTRLNIIIALLILLMTILVFG